MNDRTGKPVEKLMFVAVLFIFYLLFCLKNIPASLYLSLPLETSPLPGGEFTAEEIFVEEEFQFSETATTPYTLGEAQQRELRVRLIATNTGKTPSIDIVLEVPLLAELDSPYQEVLQETFNPLPQKIRKKAQGNRSAYFQIDFLAPGESKTFLIDYQLQAYPLEAVWPVLTALSAGPVYYPAAPAAAPGLVADPGQRWLKPAAKIESDHPAIIRQAEELIAAAQDDLEKARLFFDFVKKHIRYDLDSPHRNQGALSALRNGSGVCEDYAALFVALCRAAGIPARQVNGYADPQGCGTVWKLTPAETLSLKGSRHSWAEFYLEGAGWLPADPTLNIYDPGLAYFAALPRAGHLAQNYADRPLQICFHGGKLSVTWEEELAGRT